MTPLSPLQEFTHAVDRPDPEIDLARSCLLIAASVYPDLDVERWLQRLDRLGEEAAEHLPAAGGDYDRLSALTRFLYGRYGLAGNRRCYYDARNSLLNEVLERRVGIPITLAVVVMEVGSRVGVPLVGVGMPCHFLVRHAAQQDLLLDPFDGGRVLGQDGCRELLERISEGRIRFRPELLRPAGRRQILFRVLNNLRGIWVQRGRLESAVIALEYQTALYPEEPRLRRDRGLLLLQTGEVAAGIAELEGYLATAPPGQERREAEAVLNATRRGLSLFN